MKKGTGLICLLAVTALLLFGCGRQEEEESGYIVYYVNAAGTSLEGVNYNPSAETFDEMMTELLGQLASAPAGSVYVSALPQEVEIRGYERGIDALRIDFSQEYYGMNHIAEVLLRAAVVKTICQIPGVTKIMITVDQEPLTDAQGEPVPAMDAESFIDTKNGGINSYQYATLVLYYPGEDGTRLVQETRRLHYSSNMVIGRVVIEELMKGSEHQNRKVLLNSSTQILDITVQDGICTVNFDSAFNRRPSENAASAELALYAVVNSLLDTTGSITGVRFQVNGESDVLFWEEIDLNQVFVRNTALIETEMLETEMPETKMTETETRETEMPEAGPSETEQGQPETAAAASAEADSPEQGSGTETGSQTVSGIAQPMSPQSGAEAGLPAS